MSRNTVENSYFCSAENAENRPAMTDLVKDVEARETRMPVQGKRTVLGTLTNKPFSNVAVKPKQVHITFLFINSYF